MANGFLLVIDGIDGAGKTTQIELIAQYLKEKKIPFETISFPRYGQNLYADLVKDYLEGKYGPIGQINPHFIALAYAGDRVLAKAQIKQWLNEGKIVISNRYVSASKAHLGANVKAEEREDFINWIERLEYLENGLPKEDLNILLTVDFETSQENALNKHPLDIHENSQNHLYNANKIYLDLSQKEPEWIVVNCMENDNMQSKEQIHLHIREILQKKGLI